MGSRLIWLFFLAVPADAQEKPVSVELVLALDGSASVDPEEFSRQVEGLARAFATGEVQQAIADLEPGGVAVAVLQWGGPGEAKLVLPFTQLATPREVKAFAFRMSLMRRQLWATTTSIATGIGQSAALMDGNGFAGQRRVIDVSGDGEDNGGDGGAGLAAARRAAQAAGIVVNGLPILTEYPELDGYFRAHVIAGPGCFVEPAADFDDYLRAIREKLLKELRPLAS